MGYKYSYSNILVLYTQGDLVEGQGEEGYGYNSVKECVNLINRLEFVIFGAVGSLGTLDR